MSASSEWFGGGNSYDRCLQLEQERDALVAENQQLRDEIKRLQSQLGVLPEPVPEGYFDV
jgi:cell division protein FtsB